MNNFFSPLLIDGYKLDHKRQYPEGTKVIFSNFTARKSLRGLDNIVFFGLQYFIKKYLIDEWNENFFKAPKSRVIDDFKARVNAYLGPNNVGTQHLKELHDLGYLPISIMALPEGTICPIGVPPLIIYNTDHRFYWLTNYLETLLSTTLWGACTSATTAYEYKKILVRFALETVGNTEHVKFQAHDFSMRGMFGLEAACISGAAHLTSFVGTDTIPAIDFINQYYPDKQLDDDILIGCSVPATEHSVMCAGGKDQELATIKRLITEIYPTGIVSIVSDTWDFWKTLTETAKELKDIIIARDGKVVFRPDSGDPIKIICGDPDSETQAVREGAVEVLWKIFGGAINEKGYKEINARVGLIYGDSITIERAHTILKKLKEKGFSSNNIVFGIGSYTYQYVTRDTDGYAVKATYAEFENEARSLHKDPATDDGTKKSAKGRLAVFKDEHNKLYLKQEATHEDITKSEYKVRFSDGFIVNPQTFSEIRNLIETGG